MTTRRAFTSAVLASAFALHGAFAQQPSNTIEQPPLPDNGRFGDPTTKGQNLRGFIYGVVKKVGKHELILDKTPFGDAQSFKLEPKTKYLRDGKSSKLAEFKAGDQVFVDVKKEKKSGGMIAKKVVAGVDTLQSP
ncbi:MAG TPA: hypothetical protein VKU44_07760 [Terriglobia bacterium]|nr:hypothetical protein [Terriglobia bacterium]